MRVIFLPVYICVIARNEATSHTKPPLCMFDTYRVGLLRSSQRRTVKFRCQISGFIQKIVKKFFKVYLYASE